MGPDTGVEISTRPISQEPMVRQSDNVFHPVPSHLMLTFSIQYIIANVGLSPGFGTLDFENLVFPATMSIDYIRVYQPADAINVGCDPQDFPTKAYIET
jgi:beta-glucanase (GH16 family)